jgi:hypothetical protein
MNINWNRIRPNENTRGVHTKSDGSLQFGKTKNGNASNAIAFYKTSRNKLGVEGGSKVSIGFSDNRVFITKKQTPVMFTLNSARYLYDKNLVSEIIYSLTGKYPTRKKSYKILIDFVEVENNPGIFEIVLHKEKDEFGFFEMNGVYEAC